MTRTQIAAAMKGTSDPVVLREIGPDEDPAAVLDLIRGHAPKSIGVYLRRASVVREDGRTVGLTPAAIMGRVRG